MARTIVECPRCQKRLRFQASAGRTSIACPECAQRIVVADAQVQDEPVDVEPQAFSEPVVEERKAKSGSDPQSVQDVFDYFGVGDKPTSKPKAKAGSSSARPVVENRRERQRKEPATRRKLAVAALLVVPVATLIGLGFSGFFSGSDNVQDAPPNGASESVATAEPAKPPAKPREQNPSQPVSQSGNKPGSDASASANQLPPASADTSAPAIVSHDRPVESSSTAPPGTVAASPPAQQEPPAQQTPPPEQAEPPKPKQPPVVASQKRVPANVLKYKWKSGDKHVYSLTITAGNDGRRTMNGTCTYSVLGRDQVEGKESRGSGTGFVVAADGYIATCAHVVEDAKQIDVTLGEKVYRAKVIAENRKRDIAVLKIDATDLHVLPMGDSDNVRLAERVRAFGFPLSTMLGTGLKVASGEVSGTVDDKKHGRQIQTDAPINPGNSGGPMINERGQVVGVASSKLINSVASSVGFAVPINALKAMLAEQGIPVPGAGENKKLDGPTLAEQVTPGVVFIKVRSNSMGRVFALKHQSRFQQSSLPGGRGGSGRMQVDVHGEVTSFSGEGSLPFVLGPVAQLFIEPLDEFGDAKWGDEAEGSLSIVKRKSNGFPGLGFRGFGRAFGRGFPGRFGGEPEEETTRTIPAVQRVSYKLGKEQGDRVTIHKTYEFITTDDDQNPYFSTRGKGELVFDKKLGVFVSQDYSTTVVTNDEDGRTETPVTVKFNLRTRAQVARERAEAIARGEELKKQRELERTVPNPDRIDAELDALAALGRRPAWTVLQKLAPLAVVPEKRDAVLEAVRPHLKDTSDFTASAAAKVLAKWATKDDVKELRTIMAERHHMYRDAKKEAIRKLLQYKDLRSFAAIIRQMGDGFLRRDLKPMLIDYGPKMEQSILNEFDDITDTFARMALVEVLAEIGTEDSLPLLEGLANQPHVRTPAKRAIQAIQRRTPKSDTDDADQGK